MTWQPSDYPACPYNVEHSIECEIDDCSDRHGLCEIYRRMKKAEKNAKDWEEHQRDYERGISELWGL